MALEYDFDGTRAAVRMDDGKANVLSPAFLDDLLALVEKAGTEGAGAFVLRGNDRMFSAGIDLNQMAGGFDAAGELLSKIGTGLLDFWMAPLPTIAVIEGHAIAGGLILAMCCDRRIASAKPAKIGLSETAQGMLLPTWALTIAQAAIPNEHQTESLLFARMGGPDEAAGLGLVDEVVSESEVGSRVGALVAESAELPTETFAALKKRLRGADYARAHEIAVADGAA